MLRYHIAFYLPHAPGEMVVAEALGFPGAVTQGFDLPDARLMISSALDDLAQAPLEEGSLPRPSGDVPSPDADLIELVPLSVRAGAAPRGETAPTVVRSHGCNLSREGGRYSISQIRRHENKLRSRAIPKSTIASLERSALNSGFHR